MTAVDVAVVMSWCDVIVNVLRVHCLEWTRHSMTAVDVAVVMSWCDVIVNVLRVHCLE